MASTIVIPRGLLVYAICVPLAVLLGYLLADPLESGTIAVFVLLFSVLVFPILLKWHHAFLILSCNAAIYPYFLPGRPTLWMVMAVLSASVLILNRSMGQDIPFFRARNLSIAFLVLGFVVCATAYATGGIGLSVFGAREAGGKRYLYILFGIALYFGLSSISIKPKYTRLAVAAFFLSALTGLVGYIAAFGGSGFYFLEELFPIEGALDETSGATDLGVASSGIVRLTGLASVAAGVFCYMLARYGVRGSLDLGRPWRVCVLLLTVAATLYSGFRSGLIMLMLLFGLMFYIEGLFRTRLFPVLTLIAILLATISLPFVQKLPLGVQRTLCFLPINVDPIVRSNAQDSTDWRVEMWKEVIPTIPRYLIRGKGYSMDINDAFLLSNSHANGYTSAYAGAMLAGDYHNGPLSVIIPFGIAGVIGFFWILGASLKVLRLNYRFGDPSLQCVNTFLLAYFIARIIFFFFVFGSLYTDIGIFAGLVGLSVSLNQGVAQPKLPNAEVDPPTRNPYPYHSKIIRAQ